MYRKYRKTKCLIANNRLIFGKTLKIHLNIFGFSVFRSRKLAYNGPYSLCLKNSKKKRARFYTRFCQNKQGFY